MAHYRPRDRVQAIKLECEIWIVTEFDKKGNPKKAEPIPASEAEPWAVFALGSGKEQGVQWMEWDKFEQRYEPEEEIGLHGDGETRAAARRTPYEDRRNGHADRPYYEGPPPPFEHRPAWEPYQMPKPTLLPNAALPKDDDERLTRAEKV